MYKQIFYLSFFCCCALKGKNYRIIRLRVSIGFFPNQMSCFFCCFIVIINLKKVLIIRGDRGEREKRDERLIMLESEARNEFYKSQHNFQFECINNWLRISEQQAKLWVRSVRMWVQSPHTIILKYICNFPTFNFLYISNPHHSKPLSHLALAHAPMIAIYIYIASTAAHKSIDKPSQSPLRNTCQP